MSDFRRNGYVPSFLEEVAERWEFDRSCYEVNGIHERIKLDCDVGVDGRLMSGGHVIGRVNNLPESLDLENERHSISPIPPHNFHIG